MTSPTFGLVFNRTDEDPRPAQATDFSVVGLVLPSTDADAVVFPLNEPVAFDSGDPAKRAKLGTGALAKEVDLLDAQLADFQSSARIVAVRVAEGVDEAATMTNIIGSASATTAAGHMGTGLHGLKRAGVQLGIIPRLIGAPGYTHQVTVTGGVTEANPVCAALPGILSALLAHAVVTGPDGQVENLDWRETMSSPRIIPNADFVRVSDGVTVTDRDGAAAILGAMVRNDFQHRGYPFWSAANQHINGIVGLKTYRPFSLTDGATEGQEILATRTGVFQRGQIGVDAAATDSGFVWIGVHNCDDDPLWWFYNKGRARDWAHLALLKSIRRHLGRENITPRAVDRVLEDCVEIGQQLIQNGGSLGFRVAFDGSTNSVEELRQGRFRVSFETEEPPPIMQVGIDSKPYRKAMEITLAAIIAQSQTLLPQYVS